MKSFLFLVLLASLAQAISLSKIDPYLLNATHRAEYWVPTRVQEGLDFSEALKARLLVRFTTCKEAWWDMLYWSALLYGDIYGNNGANTLAYYFWQYLWVRAPQWVSLCVQTNL